MSDDSEQLSGKALDPRLLRRLLAFARPHARGFIVSSLLLLLLAALTLAIPHLLGEAVDAYLAGTQASALSETDRATGVQRTAIILAVIGLGTFALRLAQIIVTNLTGQRVIHDLRVRVFSHITRQDLRFFDRHPVGTLVTRVTGDIETLNEFFVSGIDVLFSDVLRIIAITVVLFVSEWRMAIATLAVLPAILLWAFVFQRRSRRLFREVRGEIGRTNAFMNEALSGIQVVHAFGQVAAVHQDFRTKNASLRDAHLRTVRNFAWFFPGMEFLTAAASAAVLVAGYVWVHSGRLEPGDVVKFWLYLSLFIDPLRQLADKYNILQSAVAAGERVFRVLDTESALPRAAVPTSIGRPKGHVVFENVHFSYNDGEPVLRGVSFEADPGSSVAIVGPTGSGKSTIINLLSRFYDPQSGRITLDGVDLRALEPERLRRSVGLVLQDTFLFDGTLRENLSLGDPALDDATLQRAATAAQADRIIERLGGLGGRIRERGATLSTGEKQLLAFARTLAFDPALLVLDEATAHIDTETEVLVQRALARLLKGRTAIIIAHRLSTIQKCDRILVVHHGEIREAGTHEELVALDGIYARLHRLQFDE